MVTPTVAFEQILASAKVVSNRWLTLTNLAPADYRLSQKSKARGAGNSAALQGWPNVEDLNGTPLTDSNGALLPAAAILNMGAYQSLAIPRLQINNTGASLQVTWPADSADWKLFTATSLASSQGWEQILNGPALEGSNWVFQVPATESQRFYQLRAQQLP